MWDEIGNIRYGNVENEVWMAMNKEHDNSQKEWLLKIPDWLEKTVLITGACGIGCVLLLLLLCGEYPDRLADNRYLILISLALILVIGLCCYFLTGKTKVSIPHPLLLLGAGYLLLWIIQIVWVDNVYFYTGWDVGVMKVRVESIVNGSSMTDISADIEYSVYPNNLLLFYVFCLIEKVGGLLSMWDPYKLCIYGSCFCVNFSCFLGNLIMRKMTDSGILRTGYTLISTAVILFSPWIIIPYSDTYGMLFVMLGMWGLICVDKKYLKWAIVAFASIIGYYIKPTCIFPLFAACILYGTGYAVNFRKKWRELLSLVLSIIIFWGAGLLIPLWIQHTYNFKLIPEARIPYTHFLMMGFNETSKGGYNFADYLYSKNLEDVESRKKANMEVFWQRLEDMARGKRLGRFLRDKALVNFNDGTFAWTEEGVFFLGFIDHDNAWSKWFGHVMVPENSYEGDNDGKFYPLYRTVMQIMWLFMLAGIPFVVLNMKNLRREKACMMLVLGGLLVFVMLFEARARYLYLYSPIFLILSLCGCQALFRFILPGSLYRYRP
ncbi:MAG: hypothetical protein NC416_17740 [Eubacterium sp.]|nr:hypothetical protein [Eubacterium sp.]